MTPHYVDDGLLAETAYRTQPGNVCPKCRPRPISAIPGSSAEDWATRLSYLSGMSAADQVASLPTEPDFRKYLNLDMGVTRADASPPAD